LGNGYGTGVGSVTVMPTGVIRGVMTAARSS
jgi:hypothetical protein